MTGAWIMNICFTKEMEESKIKPRLRADIHGRIREIEGRESDGLDSFESC